MKKSTQELLQTANRLRWKMPIDLHDRVVESFFSEASRITKKNVHCTSCSRRVSRQGRLDALLVGRWTGFPIMVLLLAVILWITIELANIPSSGLSWLLIGKGYPALQSLSLPWRSFLIDGIYLTVAWVVSVMLPPMAIFFPLFTLLEDFGYLPRVAFNLDRVFQGVGAHGKQALTMTMGFGCNAAGVISARIIDSPRERLIAILTNNFSICNGRWPTQILIASVFLGALVPPFCAGVMVAGMVSLVAIFGVVLALVSSWILSKSLLRGETSAFSLELPPFRLPRFWRTLYTSVIDRTLFVLVRAVIFAVPAGAVIWVISHVSVGGGSLATYLVDFLEPVGFFLGLNGVILLGFLIATAANEMMVPAVLMLTMMKMGGTGGVLFGEGEMQTLLSDGGITTLTAICWMLFCLCRSPCSTALYTIYKETGSWKWVGVAALLPMGWGVVFCGGLAAVWRCVS